MRAFIVALREIRTFLADKADLAFALLLPILTFALMYGAYGGQQQFNGTAYIVNEDRGIYSQRLIEQLKKANGLAIKLLSSSDAMIKLDRSNVLLALYIPDDFSQKLASGQSVQLLFKQRGNGGQEGQIVASIIRGTVQHIATEFQVNRGVTTALAGTSPDIIGDAINMTVNAILEKQQQEHPIIEIKEEIIGIRTDPILLYLFGIITMYALFAVTLNARAVVEERQKGTLERLLTTRLTVWELFAGKFMANMGRGFLQMLILLALSYAVFHIFTPLSFIQILVLAFIFAAAVSALGLLIAAIARTADQATWIAVFFTMVMVMLGGTFFKPSSGSLLATISKISVNTYANNAFDAIVIQGRSLASVGFELGVLAAIVIVCLPISRLLFRVIPGGK